MDSESDTPPEAPVTELEREAAEAPVMASRWAIHRHLYDWMISFAHHRHAGRALFGFSFAESSVFPIPPDVLLAPMCLGHREKAFRFATICTVASVLGALLGYALGHFVVDWMTAIPGIDAEGIAWLQAQFEQRGSWYVFIAALTPIPFKLLTITAGAASMNLPLFVAACVIGRAARFYAVGALFWWIGPRALPIIDRYFNLLCVVFAVLLIGGFVGVKWLRGH